MPSLTVTFAPARTYQRLLWLSLASLLLPLLLLLVPPVIQRERAVPAIPDAPPTDAPVAPAPTTQRLPPGLGLILNATLAADSAEGYAPVTLASPSEGLRADNPAQRFATTFDASGVRIAPANGAAFSMRATAIITASGSSALPTAPPISTGARVEYRHDGLTEWYVNGPRGLEQGFTIAVPPTGATQFTISLAVAGDVPTLADNGLVIGDLRYRDLMVTDAAGRRLPAHLDLANGEVRIAVDARGAQWPVTVDPLITQATLAAPDAGSAYYFGSAVAIATANGTNTVVVGAPSDTGGVGQGQGYGYIFTGNGTTYTKQARLTATDGKVGDAFGKSVAVGISGGTTTVVVGAPNAGTNSQGQAYVFTGSGSAYTQQSILAPIASNASLEKFGTSVALVINGGTATIAVGAPNHCDCAGGYFGGAVSLYAGSGASYPLQTTLIDTGTTEQETFGTSVALASSGGTNTLAVGAPGKNSGQGAAFVYTGGGPTYSRATLSSADGTLGDAFGSSVAVAVSGGTTAVAVGAPYKTPPGHSTLGEAYIFTSSGSAYAGTPLFAPIPDDYNYFGSAVAVGFSYSVVEVAVGGKFVNTNKAEGPNVLVFTQSGSQPPYSAGSALPEPGATFSDGYGQGGLAMVVGPNQNPTVVGGAPNAASVSGSATLSSWDASASLRTLLGDGSQMLASPAASNYSGTPFHLVASLVDGNGTPLPSAALTFTVNANGSTGGVFTASDPTSTILHVTTNNGTNGTAGQTNIINLYPSSAAGQFTVTVTADGTALTDTYRLTILASVPKPTINPVVPVRTTSAAKQSPQPNATTAQPAGLSPATIIIDTTKTYEIHINGSGFVKQTYSQTDQFAQLSTSFIRLGLSLLMTTVYVSSTELIVYLTGDMLTGVSADTMGSIIVYNPPSTPGGTDGGQSNPVNIFLAMPRTAPTGSTLSCSGSTNIIALQDSLVVAAPCQVVDGSGHPVPIVVTGKATGFVGTNGGELVAAGGGNLITQDGGGLISQDGGGIVSAGGGNLIINDGGSLVSAGGGNLHSAVKPASMQTPVFHSVQSGGANAPIRAVTAAPSATGDYIASTDAHSIIMAPPVRSNGIPGTYTRTLTVDGVAGGVTYTITNLNPHDGHPTTITALSRSSAYAGDPAFTLTVTGTGFINGSVISYGGVQLATTFDSATQIHATVPANLLNYTGALSVLVINPDPNGGASLPVTFTVTLKVNPLPPPQPSVPPVTGPAPLPGGRPTVAPVGGATPAPLPPRR